MHNLHICRVNADCHEEASEKVEVRLSTWGDENNCLLSVVLSAKKIKLSLMNLMRIGWKKRRY